MHFTYTEIIRVAESKDGKLNSLLDYSHNELHPTCISRALVLAVQNKQYLNMHQLLLNGATELDIDKALAFAEDKVEYANLVLVKGVVANSTEPLIALWKSCQDSGTPLAPAELWRLPSKLPLKISLRRKDISVIQAYITGDDGTVANWSDLQLSEQDMQLLTAIAGVQNIKTLLLNKNQLEGLPLTIANFQQVSDIYI